MPQQALDYLGPKSVPSPSAVMGAVRRWWKLIAVIIAITVTLGVYGLWLGLGRHVTEAHPASAAEVAEFTDITPPAAATKIWASSFIEGGGQGFSHYVRFEAPPSVCLQYASKVVHSLPLSAISTTDAFNVRLDADVFRNTSWFDIDKAVTLVGARGPMPRPNIHVWVDTSRGVFYFFECD